MEPHSVRPILHAEADLFPVRWSGLLAGVVKLTKKYWLRIAIVGAAFTSTSYIPSKSGASSDVEPNFDPAAMSLLNKMSQTYGQIQDLIERTEVHTTLVPVTPDPSKPTDRPDSRKPEAPDQVSQLWFHAPNKLRVEILDPQPTALSPDSYLCVCDGRYCWTYVTEKNVYTKEKLPSNIHEFSQLTYLSGGGFDMAMLMDTHPFATAREEMESVRLLPDSNVRDVETQVVRLETESPEEKSAMTLFIGKKDSLLYRMIVDTVPKSRDDSPIRTGGPLDDLLEVPARRTTSNPNDANGPNNPNNRGIPGLGVDSAPDLPITPMKAQAVYDYTFDSATSVESAKFAYKPPANAFTYGQPYGAQKPKSLKQRLAEIAKAVKKQKAARPHTVRF